MICDAAQVSGIDPVALLALLKAESGLNPKAERWGTETKLALWAIQYHDNGALQGVIDRVWMDISFGYGQQIVAYNYLGNHQATVENCLAVRDGVFSGPERNIRDAAARLASDIPRSLDNSPLGGMVVYNAGSDRRNDPAWMARWAGNVASYQQALAWAEQYRV